MGRGRNGVLIQSSTIGKRRTRCDINKEYSDIISRNNAVQNQEEIFLDLEVLNYLRGLRPSEIVKTVLPPTPGSR